MTTKGGINAKSLTVRPYFTVAGFTVGRADDFVSIRKDGAWEFCIGNAPGEARDFQAVFIRLRFDPLIGFSIPTGKRRHWKFKSRLLAWLAAL